MAQRAAADFLAGVIEGFYGQPWSQVERFELFEWMGRWGLNTYMYAPKDDLKHRALWREPYSTAEAAAIGEMIGGCQKANLRFIYALSPGLDIRYGDEAELECLRNRCEQLRGLGCRNFALLFDDIPDRLEAEDQKRWGSFASAQCHVTNAVFQWVNAHCPEARLLFCPTPYCGRMAARNLGGEGYLQTLGRELHPDIEVFWTGPEIISPEITVAHARELQRILRRKPLIWDNLHANDYDGRRFYCGPYAGRPPELRQEVSGLLVNPNSEFPLNFVPLRTLGEFVHSQGSWNPRQAYLAAMAEWLRRFETCGPPITLEDLIRFGDCYYLPHEEGPEAEGLYERIKRLVAATEPGGDCLLPPAAARLYDFCVRMTELRHRPLFYALSRRIWDLREELALLDQYVKFKAKLENRGQECASDFHLPGTYRGGMVARLQRLLVMQPDGTFAPRGQEGQVVGGPKFAPNQL